MQTVFAPKFSPSLFFFGGKNTIERLKEVFFRPFTIYAVIISGGSQDVLSRDFGRGVYAALNIVILRQNVLVIHLGQRLAA